MKPLLFVISEGFLYIVIVMPPSRFAYKSSSGSAKRDRAPCLVLSAKSERATLRKSNLLARLAYLIVIFYRCGIIPYIRCVYIYFFCIPVWYKEINLLLLSFGVNILKLFVTVKKGSEEIEIYIYVYILIYSLFPFNTYIKKSKTEQPKQQLITWQSDKLTCFFLAGRLQFSQLLAIRGAQINFAGGNIHLTILKSLLARTTL